MKKLKYFLFLNITLFNIFYTYSSNKSWRTSYDKLWCVEVIKSNLSIDQKKIIMQYALCNTKSLIQEDIRNLMQDKWIIFKTLSENNKEFKELITTINRFDHQRLASLIHIYKTSFNRNKCNNTLMQRWGLRYNLLEKMINQQTNSLNKPNKANKPEDCIINYPFSIVTESRFAGKIFSED